MAKVTCSFIVGAHLNGRVAAVSDVPERSVDVDQLDSGIGERDKFSLGG